jgi:hypothetical protein
MAKKPKKEFVETPETLEEALQIIETLNAVVNESTEIINDLRVELSKANKKSIEKTVLKLDDRSFTVDCKSFHLDGVEHQSENLTDNCEILAKLVEIEAGFVTEVF